MVKAEKGVIPSGVDAAGEGLGDGEGGDTVRDVSIGRNKRKGRASRSTTLERRSSSSCRTRRGKQDHTVVDDDVAVLELDNQAAAAATTGGAADTRAGASIAIKPER